MTDKTYAPTTPLERVNLTCTVVIPFMQEHPERVDFSMYASACRTHKCLLGWYLHLVEGLRGFDDIRKRASLLSASHVDERCAFGMSLIKGEWVDVFGSRSDRTLNDRLAVLNKVAARLEAQAHDATPSPTENYT